MLKELVLAGYSVHFLQNFFMLLLILFIITKSDPPADPVYTGRYLLGVRYCTCLYCLYSGTYLKVCKLAAVKVSECLAAGDIQSLEPLLTPECLKLVRNNLR